METTEKTRRGKRRSGKPADEMAPAVREIAAVEFAERPNSEVIANRFGSGRLHVIDAIVYELARDVRRMQARLATRDGFGRPLYTSAKIGKEAA